MYQQPHRAWIFLIFIPIGLAMAAGGYWLKQKFRDPNEGQPGFRSWGLGPRGALEGVGMGLIYFGLFFALGGLVLPFLL